MADQAHHSDFSHQETTIYRAPNVYPENYVDLSTNGVVLLRPTMAGPEFLFEDPLGLPRYIGPTGSFTLLMRLRELMAVRSTPGMSRLEYAQTMGQSLQTDGSGKESLHLPPRAIADALVDMFFSKVNCDYPVFHRALFAAKYEMMWSNSPDSEPAWLMTLYMIFTLALTASSRDSFSPSMQAQKDALRDQFISRAKLLLPEVLYGATLGHVQALMVFCLYLHISRERNACWNIAGSAIRIALAIGLHRNGANTKCTPLERELRKRVWWTLYFFERIEASSLGRPSAINDAECNVDTPTDGLLDMSDFLPLGFIDAQGRLLRILGQICTEQSNLDRLTGKHAELAGSISGQLDEWQRVLPAYLCLGAPVPPTHQRPIILLHIQFHYTITILTRPYLIARASAMSNSRVPSPQIDFYARKSMEAAISAATLLQNLFTAGLFNAKTWWDVFFIESTAMILALGRIIDDDDLFKDIGDILGSLKTCLNILTQCGELSPTMQRFARVTTEFGQALVVAKEKQTKPQEIDRSAQGDPYSATPDPLSSISEKDAFDMSDDSRDFYGTTDVSDVWLNLFQDQDDLGDFQMPLDWDDPPYWLTQ